jgi:alkyl hydroperoxide reductase subunit AhpC
MCVLDGLEGSECDGRPGSRYNRSFGSAGWGAVRGVSSEHQKTIVAVGDLAPDFDLPALIAGVKKRFHLKDALEEKNIVLAFYPSNWEEVSAKQLSEYQSQRKEFLSRESEVVGICVDSIMNTTVWERELGPLDFPLCSDFWPHGEVSQAYGVFCDHGANAGTSDRAIVIVERNGRIRFSKVYGGQDLPPISETLEALRQR